jgi:hypothetical protein
VACGVDGNPGNSAVALPWDSNRIRTTHTTEHPPLRNRKKKKKREKKEKPDEHIEEWGKGYAKVGRRSKNPPVVLLV